MSSIYVSPIFATQYHIYNIIGPTTVLTIWSINLMPIKRQKKFASCVTTPKQNMLAKTFERRGHLVSQF